jgi:hypothetical protein
MNRAKVERVLRWGSIALGGLILTSCTVGCGAVGSMSDGSFSLLRMLSASLGGFVVGTTFVSLALGWIYAYFVLRRDIAEIHEALARMEAEAKPSPASKSVSAPPSE